MKKISRITLITLIVAFAAALAFTACTPAAEVDSVTLDITSKSLKIGETVKLTATVAAPDESTDKTVRWSSSKSTVAAVDSDGLVTAKTAGTATITATSKANSGKKATCEITVTDPSTAAVYKGAGQYKVGTDIEAGEYLLVKSGTVDGYFAVTESKDSSSVLYNDSFVRTYVVLETGLWIKVDRANIYTLDNDPGFTKNANNGFPVGMYKVGKDLDAGIYIAHEVSASSDPYFSVYKANTPHGTSNIVNIDNFSYRAYVELTNGQYIYINRCALYAPSDAPAITKNTDGSYKPGMYKIGAGAEIQPGSYNITRLDGSEASYAIFPTPATTLLSPDYIYVSLSLDAAGTVKAVTLSENTYIQLKNCTLK